MSLLYQFEASAKDLPLSFAPTPVLSRRAASPPEISRVGDVARKHNAKPRSFAKDLWLHDESDGVGLGRVMSDRALTEKTRRILTNMDVVVHIDVDKGVMRAIRGRFNGRALWGHHLSLAAEKGPCTPPHEGDAS